jgi:stage V sporulation protein B
LKLNKQSFLHGAIILAMTNFLVKILGAVFKIPLRRLIGPDGMGIFTQAYVIYAWMFIIATAGMPVAISKMVSESAAKGRHKEAKKVFIISFILLNIIGILGTLLLFFGAEKFAIGLRDPKVALSIKAVAPSLWFVSVMSAFRGYFQGQQNMIPTSLSELAEVLGKLFIGYSLASFWLVKGLEYAGAGAILGVTSGTFFGMILLVVIYKSSTQDLNSYYHKSEQKTKTSKSILFELVKIAVPITIGASVFTLTNVIDMAMIKYRLQMIGFSTAESRTLYGYYSNDAVTMFNLPPTIIVALGVSLVPVIARAFALKNFRNVKTTTETAIRITVLFSLPCAIGLSILSGPILKLIYNDSGATTLLKILGIAVFFVSLVLVSNAILQATGKVMIPVRNMFLGGMVKIVANYILVGNIAINIKGAPIGTILCYFVISILNIITLKRVTKAEFKLSEFFLKPIISVILMGITAVYVYKTLYELLNINSLATLIAIISGGIAYVILLFAVKSIREEDIILLPKGETILKKLKKYKLIR